MDTARIDGLLKPFLVEALTPPQLGYISMYIDLLVRWNARVNLTAIREPEEIVTRHFGESLFAARHLFSQTASSVAHAGIGGEAGKEILDIGSGAGFPGIPLKIWAPQLSVTLIESNGKKVAFLREVCRALTLTYIDVFSGRAEELPGQADLVTLRAVERFDAILPVAVRLVTPGGRLALLISAGQISLTHGMAGMQWSDPISLPLSWERVLLVGTKVG